MAKVLMTPKSLVKNAKARHSTGKSWYHCLGTADRGYVTEVVKEIGSNPDVCMLLVADGLIRELGLGVTRQTVAKTLREIVNAKA